MSAASGVGKPKLTPVRVEQQKESIKEFQSYFHSGASITDCANAYALLRRSMKDEYQIAFIERFFTDVEPASQSVSCEDPRAYFRSLSDGTYVSPKSESKEYFQTPSPKEK